MSDTIVAAIIGATAIVAAALISRLRWSVRSRGVVDRPSPDDVYMLGAYVSKIIWGKFGMLTEQSVTRSAIPVLYERAEISEALQAEFDRIVQSIESTGTPKEVVPHLRQLFGVYISTAFGNRKGQFFALGFDSISLLSHLDIASVLPNGPALFLERLRAMIKDATELKCPVVGYLKLIPIVEKGFSGLNDPVVLNLRIKLLDAGGAIHDQLDKSASDVATNEVIQMRRIADRTR